MQDRLVSISYGNAGILQRLTIGTLDAAGIFMRQDSTQHLTDPDYVDTSARKYAKELDSVYLTFAKRVSKGIRKRRSSTGIYAHAMAAVLEQKDEPLKSGIPTKNIYNIAKSREPRIQLGNLRSILGNIERLQVDEEGRGLVLAFANDKVRVVDYQLLLYRQFLTADWTWQDLIDETDATGEGYDTPEN